ncbi:hypothetical protein CAL13_14060 [Bordetella genomosp. 9]|uniref:Bacterial shufflon protein N-terminal domain-containing protein n=2 Tax=Bordetella genomosp. 9 TaxID=1416803 RepID=A0A1W6Z1H3_9BORD|nr:hypothetical protein CAL13_14060 [Bordetella genomosp. 9]
MSVVMACRERPIASHCRSGAITHPRQMAGWSACNGRQAGVALIELAIAMAVVCLLVVWAADKLLHQVDEASEQAAGRWLIDMQRGLEGLLARHGAVLGEGAAPADDHGRPLYADPFSPTVAELKAQGHLDGAFPERGPLAIHPIVRIWRAGGCPGQACRVDAIAYSAAPLLRAGQPDLGRIGGILLASGGAGGAVSQLAPHRLRGAGFDLPNPPAPGMAPLPVGTVAVRAGREAAAGSRFIQRRDARNPDFLGDLSAQGAISAKGRLETDGHLKLGGTAIPGEACAENGLLAHDGEGRLLNCVAGVWSGAGGFGGAFSWNSGGGCSRAPNPLTGRCDCPPGFRAVLVSSGGVGDWTAHGWTEGYVCVRTQSPGIGRPGP